MMANSEDLEILQEGVAAWNEWRGNEPNSPSHTFDRKEPDLSGADLRSHKLTGFNFIRVKFTECNLSGVNLSRSNFFQADFRGANLKNANLNNAMLSRADLSNTNLEKANLDGATLTSAILNGASLVEAHLIEANLSGAKLRGANLTNACLVGAALVGTDLSEATINQCEVYGVSTWDICLDNAQQKDLIITPFLTGDEPIITVDNLKVAQFIYLLLSNEDIREVIDTITSKVVLILGRFTPRRKLILDALRSELRNHGYSPVIFDFQRPATRSYRETVSTLAHMSRFIIADLTGAKVVLQELERVVPTLTSVPVQPILQAKAKLAAVVSTDYTPYPWFLPIIHYKGLRDTLSSLPGAIINAAEGQIKQMIGPKSAT